MRLMQKEGVRSGKIFYNCGYFKVSKNYRLALQISKSSKLLESSVVNSIKKGVNTRYLRP